MLSRNAMYLQKREQLLEQNTRALCVYNIRCEKNNKIYIGQNINLYKSFKQHMCKPPKKMKHDIDMNKTINLTFKLDILYSNMHKYKVDKMENHYIQYFDSTSSICYNNFKENLHHTKNIGIW
jgi:hypothetical protein